MASGEDSEGGEMWGEVKVNEKKKEKWRMALSSRV